MSVGDSTGLFLALTPESVLGAVEASGLACRPLCYPLNSFENRVYEVELADRSRVVAKFYRPGRWSPEQILEEHAFLADCEAVEIPVCAARAFPDGRTLHTVEGIHYAVFDRRGGRAPDELDLPLARRLGMLIGRLHNVGAAGAAPHRLLLDSASALRTDLDWLATTETIPNAYAGRFLAAGRELADLYDALAGEVPLFRLHGDLHLGNILLRDGQLRLLDFDDMATGPAAQDLWLALPGRDQAAVELRDALLDGYEQFREFDRRTLRLVEPLRGMRMARYAAWLARRWHDPIFPIAWPQFGTDDYWRRGTEDLEEQLAVARSEASAADREAAPTIASTARAGGGAEEPQSELSNKDFFWDWEGE